MTEEELDDLKVRTENLLRLLNDQHPGLWTYCGAVNEAWWNVVNWAPEAARERLDA